MCASECSPQILSGFFVFVFDFLANTFFVMLIVLYLLFEPTHHGEGSLRALVDEQVRVGGARTEKMSCRQGLGLMSCRLF